MNHLLNKIALLCTLILSFCGTLSAEEKPAPTVWIDVRSSIEHKLDNIEGDLRVSHSKILEAVEAEYPNKDTAIKLYCRSGGRAGKALKSLQEAGYTNVKNIGSIGDARLERGIKEQ